MWVVFEPSFVNKGEQINNIESNLEETAVKVDEGKVCLADARKKHSSRRKCKVICGSIIGGTITIAIIVVLCILFV